MRVLVVMMLVVAKRRQTSGKLETERWVQSMAA